MLTLLWDERGVVLEHYMPRGNTEQCNVCRSPKESSASCSQVQTMGTSEYGCFVATWQCSAPYCPFNCCNNPRSVLRVSSTSAILAPSNFHVFGLLKEAMGGKSFRSDESGRCMSGCALSQNTFFLEVSMHFRSAGTLVWYTIDYI
jgi:hypothetical protein